MSRTSTIRRCRACQAPGRQSAFASYPHHCVRQVSCRRRACRAQSFTLELFLGAPSGRRRGAGQARQLLDTLLEGPISAACERIAHRNERYAELVASGAVLPANAVRTCISCAEPGRPYYGSNYGPYIVRCYECTDLECAERWLSAEFSMAGLSRADLADLSVCIARVREATQELDAIREAARAARRAQTAARHAERQRLMEELATL